jgi:hypothetical protein
MTTQSITGRPAHANKALLTIAVDNQPSLFIDCSQAANPYTIDAYTPEQFRDVYVLEVEMLYKFRDTVRAIPRFLNQTNASTLCVTDTATLFDYDNDEENKAIRRNAGKRLRRLGQDIKVYVVNPERNNLFPSEYCTNR